jgi:hypothetical protein
MKLDELERLAKAATPGPWQVRKQQAIVRYSDDETTFDIVAGAQADADLDYIAALSPDVALKLIAVVREVMGLDEADMRESMRCRDLYDALAALEEP